MALPAANLVEITIRLADVPAGIKLPPTAEKLADIKGVNVLVAPSIMIAENAKGIIEVAQSTAVPGGGAVPLGVQIEVKTKLTEKGNLWFSGVVTDRSRSGGEKSERMETFSFATREMYFSGWTPSGQTVVLRTSPATAKTTQDGKNVASSRELAIYMTFKKSKISSGKTTPKKAPPKAPIKKTNKPKSKKG